MLNDTHAIIFDELVCHLGNGQRKQYFLRLKSTVGTTKEVVFSVLLDVYVHKVTKIVQDTVSVQQNLHVLC